jgi:4-amino-4-deoxy-L-arabinose transferase-like glycosyltransferase
MFALASALDPGHPLGDTTSAGPDRTAQAVAGAATVLVVFGIAASLAGVWAGLAAALVLAVFPPAVLLGATFLTEPLGAFGLALAALALVWAFHGRRRRFVLAGALLGLACLVRADLLSAALLVPAGVALATPGRWRGERLVRAGATLAGLAVVLAPWTVYASTQERRFVPVTTGTGATSFVATYLPGHGTLFGAKRRLLGEACLQRPVLCRLQARGRHPSAHQILVAVAERRGPGRPIDVVLRDEAVRNLGRYGVRHPIAFTRMEAGKLWRMWGSAFYGPRWRPKPGYLAWVHRAVALAALAGILAGLARTRDRRLALLLAVLVAATLLNVFFVAEARANARLFPVLIAAGSAGAFLALRRREPATPADRAPAPP